MIPEEVAVPLSEELKACPFCGGSDSVRTSAVWPEYTFVRVGCIDCGAMMEKAWTRAEAIAAWNRRSPSSSDSERIERLSQAIRDVWPHLTGHCMEGSTPECYGYMRDRLSSVVEGLPYASDLLSEGSK
jgi:Lar family restriction alleviation protein